MWHPNECRPAKDTICNNKWGQISLKIDPNIFNAANVFCLVREEYWIYFQERLWFGLGKCILSGSHLLPEGRPLCRGITRMLVFHILSHNIANRLCLSAEVWALDSGKANKQLSCLDAKGCLAWTLREEPAPVALAGHEAGHEVSLRGTS